MEKFYEAWNYLENHKIFNTGLASRFVNCLDIEVVKVDPVTNRIENDQKRNTKTAVWLEAGRYYPEATGSPHDPKFGHNPYLDCGGDSFEEAIIKLAKKVKAFYK